MGGKDPVAGRSNEAAARVLERFSEVYDALGDSRRSLAYDRAAASVRTAGARLGPGTTEEELDALPHVGRSIAAKLREYLTTGTIRDLDALEAREVPRDFHKFVAIAGLGPKTALRLFRELGVGTLDDLEEAVKSGRARDAGVHDRLRERILEEIPKVREGGPRRVLLAKAWIVADDLVAALRRVPGVQDVSAAGSVRRRKPTVGDVDLVATHRGDADAVVDAFTRLSPVRGVLQRGEHTRVVLESGLEADLWVVAPSGWGAALSYATGSREHTLELRRRAQAKGWSVKNDAVVDARGRAVPVAAEEEFYEALGLRWIPPELRENRGEIEAALRGELPRLVDEDDLRGDLQMHTTASDGTATIEEMAAAAAALGREYVAVTDHAHGLPVPRGLDDAGFLRLVDDLAERELPIPVLAGAEVNIMGDGSLSLEDATLERLDVVVASVHSGLRDSRAKITQRVTDALSTGLVDILGHPTNRRLPKRLESDIDFDRVFDVAREHGTAMEVDGSPERMDLPGALVKRAKDAGLKFAIDSDAHHPRELANVEIGLAMARRGWLEADDVITALPYKKLRAWLKRRRSRRGGGTRAGAAATPAKRGAARRKK